jgi:hypothetical protein
MNELKKSCFKHIAHDIVISKLNYDLFYKVQNNLMDLEEVRTFYTNEINQLSSQFNGQQQMLFCCKTEVEAQKKYGKFEYESIKKFVDGGEFQEYVFYNAYSDYIKTHLDEFPLEVQKLNEVIALVNEFIDLIDNN